MSERELGPLDPDVEALLSAERGAGGATDEARARVRSRVLGSIGVVGAATTTVGSASGSHTAMQGARLLPKLLSSLPAKLVVAALGVTAVGLGVRAGMRASAPPPAKVRAEAPGERGGSSFGSVAAPGGAVDALKDSNIQTSKNSNTQNAAAENPLGARAAKSAPATRSPAAPRDGDEADHLAAERALLEPGRDALAHGNPARALAAAERHAHRFPRGQLVEERESLRIRALAAVGRADEAQARAAEFRARFPRSIFLPIVNDAVPPAP